MHFFKYLACTRHYAQNFINMSLLKYNLRPYNTYNIITEITYYMHCYIMLLTPYDNSLYISITINPGRT